MLRVQFHSYHAKLSAIFLITVSHYRLKTMPPISLHFALTNFTVDQLKGLMNLLPDTNKIGTNDKSTHSNYWCRYNMKKSFAPLAAC